MPSQRSYLQSSFTYKHYKSLVLPTFTHLGNSELKSDLIIIALSFNFIRISLLRCRFVLLEPVTNLIFLSLGFNYTNKYQLLGISYILKPTIVCKHMTY